jgi:hypothetical protein
MIGATSILDIPRDLVSLEQAWTCTTVQVMVQGLLRLVLNAAFLVKVLIVNLDSLNFHHHTRGLTSIRPLVQNQGTRGFVIGLPNSQEQPTNLVRLEHLEHLEGMTTRQHLQVETILTTKAMLRPEVLDLLSLPVTYLRVWRRCAKNWRQCRRHPQILATNLIVRRR